MLRKKGINFYLLVFLAGVYFVNGLIAIPRNSVTYDEMDHWSYGKRILKIEPEKIYPFDDASAMPVSGLNAIPRAVEQLLDPGLLKTDGGFSDIMHGRYVTLFLCLLTGFFIYRWAKDLFGERAAVFSFFLFVFCPNLNGHGVLLTTDAYTALFTVSTLYYYWKFVKKPGWKYFIFFSISLGAAQLVKYSMLHLLILLGVISLLLLIKRKTLLSNFRSNFLRLLALAAIVLLIINAGFFFKDSGKKLSGYEFASNTCSSLQSISLIKNAPVPLPEAYVKGVDLTLYMNELGAGHPQVSGKNYLLRMKKEGEGFWFYYLVIFFFKSPISVLFLLAGAVIFLFTRKKGVGHPSSMLFLLSAVFYFPVVLGFLNNVQIGIRHVLMIYPLLYVLAGYFLTLPSVSSRNRFLPPLLIAYSIASFYFFFPNLISYSNEFIIDKKQAYKKMADSNLDFGQGWYSLEKYLKQNPDVQLALPEKRAGRFVLGVNDYLDLNGTGKYKWIMSYNPAGQVNHCFLLFDIKNPE